LTADTDILQDDVTRVKTPFIAAIAAASLLVVIQWSVLPLAGLLLFASFLVSGAVMPLLTIRIERKIAAAAVMARNAISAIVTDSVNNANEMRILGVDQDLINQLRAADGIRVKVESRVSRWAGITNAINGLSAGISVIFGASLAISAHAIGQLDGTLIAVIALLPWASAEIIATFSTATTAKTRVEAARLRVDSLLQQADDVVSHAPKSLKQIMASPLMFEADRVCVAWAETDVLTNVSFTLQRGHRLAVVGPSGSGKSSLASALLRLVEHRGQVMLDSVPVENLTDFRSHVTALLQTTHIFNASLSENLTLAAAHATKERLLEAISEAGLDDWFATLPHGLETILGDGGRGMSGGEVQRIGIARVLLSEAAFVVLDEPTEHLDAATATSIWQTIETRFRDRGLVIITHDAAVAARCDEILVLESGLVVEQGSSASLLHAGWFAHNVTLSGLSAQPIPTLRQ